MATTTYGKQAIGLSSRTVGQTETVRPGVVYEQSFVISGIRTVVPGWENDAINEVKNTIESKGGTIIYISISGTEVVVQWKHPVVSASTNARAAIAPVVVYGIVIAVSIILSIWLIITATGSLKEVSTILDDSSTTTTALYGALIVAGMFAVGYILRQRRSD
jgi:hypothetical protein